MKVSPIERHLQFPLRASVQVVTFVAAHLTMLVMATGFMFLFLGAVFAFVTFVAAFVTLNPGLLAWLLEWEIWRALSVASLALGALLSSVSSEDFE